MTTLGNISYVVGLYCLMYYFEYMNLHRQNKHVDCQHTMSNRSTL